MKTLEEFLNQLREPHRTRAFLHVSPTVLKHKYYSFRNAYIQDSRLWLRLKDPPTWLDLAANWNRYTTYSYSKYLKK